MFIGQFYHRLEEKGRLSVPKKWRPQLASGSVISKGLDGCLFLYPITAWQELISKLGKLPLTRSDARSFSRSMSFAASEAEIDRLGRILVPDYLKKFAGLQSECVIAGAVDRIEIWDAKKFNEYSAQIDSQAEQIAEKLSASGDLV